MEASTARAPQLREPSLRSEQRAGARVGRGFLRPLRGAVTTAGELAVFTGRTFAELGGVWRYSAEILRQVGILIAGSTLIVCAMVFLMGVVCGTEANYVLRGYGATVYSGVFTSYCLVREMIPHMFGYIFAAKVGCGLCAEIGAMRIQDEVDAMESMGMNPIRYIVATRLVAGWLVMPLFFVLATASGFLAAYLVIVVQIGEVSAGGWGHVNWAFSTPIDFVYSFIRVMTVGTVIMLVGMFYGYRASGGPIGVGTATAKSMILNLVLLHVILAGLTTLMWGLNPNAPIGG
jgi:phospholipid/cholesterol/gamma-HCH transport system permease protein